jgi:hypothetical protein
LILDCIKEADEIEPSRWSPTTAARMRSIAVARWFAARPHLVHIRTRHR